jgi:hypothetical protein
MQRVRIVSDQAGAVELVILAIICFIWMGGIYRTRSGRAGKDKAGTNLSAPSTRLSAAGKGG